MATPPSDRGGDPRRRPATTGHAAATRRRHVTRTVLAAANRAIGRGAATRRRHVTRTVLTAANGTTGAGLLLALATRTRIRRGRNGVLIAEGWRLPMPPASCFTVGSVIITRRSAEWLLAEERAELLAHESRHAGQYAVLGPLFWPAYWVACGWSYLATGSYGVHNYFERRAGLKAGGYPEELPLRPWLRRIWSGGRTHSTSGT